MTNKTYLYLLERLPDWAWDWDEAYRFVICAYNMTHARKIASRCCGDEGPDVWLDKTESSCCRLLTNGMPRVVCSSFQAD